MFTFDMYYIISDTQSFFSTAIMNNDYSNKINLFRGINGRLIKNAYLTATLRKNYENRTFN